MINRANVVKKKKNDESQKISKQQQNFERNKLIKDYFDEQKKLLEQQLIEKMKKLVKKEIDEFKDITEQQSLECTILQNFELSTTNFINDVQKNKGIINETMQPNKQMLLEKQLQKQLLSEEHIEEQNLIQNMAFEIINKIFNDEKIQFNEILEKIDEKKKSCETSKNLVNCSLKIINNNANTVFTPRTTRNNNINNCSIKVIETKTTPVFKYENERNILQSVCQNCSNNRKKVLVIIITRNRSDKCKKVIREFLEQDYNETNILVVDDYSSDEHYKNLRDFLSSSKKVVLKRNDKNLKISGSLNVGLKYFLENNYDYVSWASDDNNYYDNYVSELVKLNSDFSYCAFNFINELMKQNFIQNKKYLDINDVINSFQGIASFMWSRKGIEKVGLYDESLYGAEDFDYIIRSFKNLSSIGYSETIVMDYIRSKDSLYYRENDRILEEFESVKQRYVLNDKIMKNPSKNKILIVVDKYMKGGLEKHTDILQKELSADVSYIYNSLNNTHVKFDEKMLDKYDIILWQNTFYNIMNNRAKHFYIVHSCCDWWGEKNMNIIRENNKYIKKYIFVSEFVKNKFEEKIIKTNNSIVIENEIKPAINNKNEIEGLYISSGSYHRMKNHDYLIKEFSKLNNAKNNLEIYGKIFDVAYFNELQQYISDNNIKNIKLFTHDDNYIERLKEAEYFCLFSKSEGCSYSILEAISLNKKIICSEECMTFKKIKEYENKKMHFDKFDKINYEYNDANYQSFINKYNNVIFENNLIYIDEYKLYDNLNYNIINDDIYYVSILIPYYNTNIEIFNNAIYSILNQNNIDNLCLEIVVVDDGTHNVYQIINNNDIITNNIRDKNIKFKIIELKKNMGVSCALNIGLKMCSYNLICRFDADDIMHPDRIYYQALYYSKRNENMILTNNFITFDNNFNKTQNNYVFGLNNIDDLMTDIYNNKHLWYACHPSIFFDKRKIKINYPNNCNNELCEDVVFYILNLFEGTSIKYDEKILHLYRNNHTNTSYVNKENFNVWKNELKRDVINNCDINEKKNAMIFIKKIMKKYYNDDFDMYEHINDIKYIKSGNFVSKKMLSHVGNLCIKLCGGIGNQLFMLFYCLNISKKENLNVYLIDEFDDKKRSPIYNSDHFIFKLNFCDKNSIDYDKYYVIKEKSFIYDDENSYMNYDNILFDAGNSGYFQSFKYFEDNVDFIKTKMILNEQKLNEIKSKITHIKNKKTMGIHIRLTDYTKLSNFHYNVKIDYYKTVVNKYDLNEYNIILFSDDYTLANKLISSIVNNIKIYNACDYCNDDYDELILLAYCDVKICPNSTFSLWSCYINEIYNLNINENTSYYFPDIWFAKDGPNYDIYDLIPINNDRYKIIVVEPKIYGIFLIATGKYIEYLDGIVNNIKNNFLTQEKKIIMVSTDNVQYIEKFNDIIDDNFIIVPNYIFCRGFPGDTLYRYEYFLNFVNSANIYSINYLMFMNLNLKINYKIDSLSLKNCDLFGTLHPGNLMNKNMIDSVEHRSNCGAFIDVKKINNKYICGGFNGGKTEHFIEMSKYINEKIKQDDENNIIAVWHDESYINHYYNNNSKKFKILSYYYCSPYIHNAYMKPETKNHFNVRTKNNLLVEFTTDINNDLLRILYCMTNYDNISLTILNTKYNLSSRQGLLKNFYRIDMNSHGINADNNLYINDIKKYDINNNNIQIYANKYYEYIYDIENIMKFVNNLYYNEKIINTQFIEKYRDYNVIHISKKTHAKYLHFFTEKCKKKFVIINSTNEKINTEIEQFYFNNDEEKIISLTQIKKHYFFEINDIFMLSIIRKFKLNNDIELNSFYGFINNEQYVFFKQLGNIKFLSHIDINIDNKLFILFDKFKYDIEIDNNKYFWENFIHISNKKESYEIKKSIGVNAFVSDDINIPMEYYENVLSVYDDTYDIILFGNNNEIISNLHMKHKNSTIKNYTNIEENIIDMMNCDIIVCDNTEYSFMQYFLNKMKNKNSKYIVPNILSSESENYMLNFVKNNDEFEIINIYKCAVIFFHKNIFTLYNKYWIDKCLNSIMNQSYKHFDMYEINYGNTDETIFNNIKVDVKERKFFSKNYQTHTEAMTFLLNECFIKEKYDIVFNTNLDDYYDNDRFIYQIFEVLKGNLINSSLFHYIEQKNDVEFDDVIYEKGNNRLIYKNDNFLWVDTFDNDAYNSNVKYDVIKKKILIEKDNIINHSGICFTRNFWNSKDKYDNKLRYRNDKPYEDLSLWFRSLDNDIKMSIINKDLIHYRIHNNQIGSQKKNIEEKKLFNVEFKNEPDLSPYKIGLLIDLRDNNFDILEKIEKNIIYGAKKVYFIMINSKYNDELISHFSKNNIQNYFIENEICKEEFVKNYDVLIEINCDYFININDSYNIKNVKNLKEMKENYKLM